MKPDLLFHSLPHLFEFSPLWVKGERVRPELRVSVYLPDGNHYSKVFGHKEVSKLQEKDNKDKIKQDYGETSGH